MIGANVKVKDKTRQAKRTVRSWHIDSIFRAAAAIRLTIRRSIRRRKKASAPGKPPHTRRGQLKRAILYAVNKERQEAVIGAAHSEVGTSGRAHEKGGTYKGEHYDQRPFAGPGLEAIRPRLPSFWRGSVG